MNLKREKWLAWGTAAIAAAIAIVFQILQLPQMRADSSDPQQAERRAALNLQLLSRMPTFGFDNIIADWTFIQFLTYFGDDEARAETGYSLDDDYFDLITRRDPRFIDIYPYLSMGVSFYQARPELADRYMRRGVAALSPEVTPRGFAIWRFLALDRLLLLGDVEGTIEAYENAADWVQGTEYERSAAQFRDTAQSLRENPNSLLARFRGWSDVFASAVDDRVRERAIRELVNLGAIPKRTPEGYLTFELPEELREELEEGNDK